MVNSLATSVEEYLAELPSDRVAIIDHARTLVLSNVPTGIVETMNFGMISYEVPLSIYPETYNGQPLMYAALASQKHHCSVYLHSVYSSEPVAEQLRLAYETAGMKLDIGKSCVRFKRLDQLHEEALAAAIGAVTVDEFIHTYEASRP